MSDLRDCALLRVHAYAYTLTRAPQTAERCHVIYIYSAWQYAERAASAAGEQEKNREHVLAIYVHDYDTYTHANSTQFKYLELQCAYNRYGHYLCILYVIANRAGVPRLFR